MKNVLLVDADGSVRLERVSWEAVAVRDEATGDWFRAAERTLVEVWHHTGPITEDVAPAR